jgi:hypothetical protein
MTHWYLTLPSNSSMKYYKDNTAAKYTTKIPDNIDLNGDWEVALTEIMYPTKMTKPPYMVNGEECFMRLFMNGEWENTLYLPDDEYEDPMTLLNDFIVLKDNNFTLTHDEKTNAIEINCNHPYASVVFSDTLARVLGFEEVKMFTLGNIYHGKLFTGDDPSTMYVYCDLIEHVTVGDVRAPLLRTFGMEKSSSDVVHRNFPNLVYVPVQKKQFDTIEINIMTDTGEPMPFASGKSVVILHFRRSSNPYFSLQR